MSAVEGYFALSRETVIASTNRPKLNCTQAIRNGNSRPYDASCAAIARTDILLVKEPSKSGGVVVYCIPQGSTASVTCKDATRFVPW
jgi:hypothetical protein